MTSGSAATSTGSSTETDSGGRVEIAIVFAHSRDAAAGTASTCVSSSGAGRSAAAVPRNRSNHPPIRRSRSTRRSGRPLRERSCDSSGKRTSSTVLPRSRIAPNISSDCDIAHRRSISPAVNSSGVRMFWT